MGVIWGEGMADQRHRTSGAGIFAYFERLIRAVRRRLFARGDQELRGVRQHGSGHCPGRLAPAWDAGA